MLIETISGSDDAVSLNKDNRMMYSENENEDENEKLRHLLCTFLKFISFSCTYYNESFIIPIFLPNMMILILVQEKNMTVGRIKNCNVRCQNTNRTTHAPKNFNA